MIHFGLHQTSNVWMAASIFVILTIWIERNKRLFDEKESCLTLKSLLLCELYVRWGHSEVIYPHIPFLLFWTVWISYFVVCFSCLYTPCVPLFLSKNLLEIFQDKYLQKSEWISPFPKRNTQTPLKVVSRPNIWKITYKVSIYNNSDIFAIIT